MYEPTDPGRGRGRGAAVERGVRRLHAGADRIATRRPARRPAQRPAACAGGRRRADRRRGAGVGDPAAERRPRGVGQRLRQRTRGDAAQPRPVARGWSRRGRRSSWWSRRCCATTPRCSCSSGPRPPTSRWPVRPVAAGEKVAVLLGSANRDEAVFERADQLDVGRDPNPHLAFGAGLHFCLGAPLARVELAESLRVLTAAYPDAGAGEPSRQGGRRSCCVGTSRCA